MFRLLVSVALAAAVAAFAVAPATAKGPNVASICGATRCIPIRGETAVWPLLSWSFAPFVTRPAPAPAPFYTIRLRDRSGIRWELLYVPKRHAVRFWQSRVPPYSQGVGPYWRTVPESAEDVFRRAVGKLSPRIAPQSWRL